MPYVPIASPRWRTQECRKVNAAEEHNQVWQNSPLCDYFDNLKLSRKVLSGAFLLLQEACVPVRAVPGCCRTRLVHPCSSPGRLWVSDWALCPFHRAEPVPARTHFLGKLWKRAKLQNASLCSQPWASSSSPASPEGFTRMLLSVPGKKEILLKVSGSQD